MSAAVSLPLADEIGVFVNGELAAKLTPQTGQLTAPARMQDRSELAFQLRCLADLLTAKPKGSRR